MFCFYTKDNFCLCFRTLLFMANYLMSQYLEGGRVRVWKSTFYGNFSYNLSEKHHVTNTPSSPPSWRARRTNHKWRGITREPAFPQTNRPESMAFLMICHNRLKVPVVRGSQILRANTGADWSTFNLNDLRPAAVSHRGNTNACHPEHFP